MCYSLFPGACLSSAVMPEPGDVLPEPVSEPRQRMILFSCLLSGVRVLHRCTVVVNGVGANKQAASQLLGIIGVNPCSV